MKLLLGTYTKRISKGIYSMILDPNTQKLKDLELVAQVDNPTYLATTEEGILSVIKNGNNGGIAYIKNGEVISQITDDAVPPCYVSYIPERKLVLTANYHGGNLEVFTLDPTTGLNHVQHIQHDAGSHTHFIRYIDRFNEILVCDLGLDEVVTYTLDDANKLSVKHIFHGHGKQGARHLVVHPFLPIYYVFAELSSEILVLHRYEDRLELIQTFSTLPKGEDQLKSGAAIRISDDGHFVYASNRGHDSISVFEVNDEGKLIYVQNVHSYGKHPRDFGISPDQNFIVVANMETDNLTLFQRNIDDGKLTLVQHNVEAPEVVCIVFEKE